MESAMRTKLVALFLIVLVANFMLAQATPAPTPKADDAKAKCALMKEGTDAIAGDKCPMMSSDKDKKGCCAGGDKDKCPMMSADKDKKGCCAGDKCKAEKMHEHAGN